MVWFWIAVGVSVTVGIGYIAYEIVYELIDFVNTKDYEDPLDW